MTSRGPQFGNRCSRDGSGSQIDPPPLPHVIHRRDRMQAFRLSLNPYEYIQVLKCREVLAGNARGRRLVRDLHLRVPSEGHSFSPQ